MLNIQGNPLKLAIRERSSEVASTRSSNTPFLKEIGMTATCKKTFINDASHIWNRAPESIKSSTSVYIDRVRLK